MKKLICTMLALMTAAGAAPACCEDAYVPGKTTASLVREALSDGKMLAGNFSLSLSGDADALGSDYEDIEKIADFLGTLQFYGAFGTASDGSRAEFAMRIGNTAGAPEADLSLSCDSKALHVESSLLGNQRFSIDYASLPGLLGLKEEDLLLFSGIPENGQSLFLSALLPYAEELSAFAAGHAGTPADSIEAQDIFPAVDHEYSWCFTAEEAAGLLRKMAGEVRSDAALSEITGNALPFAADLLESIADAVCAQQGTDSNDAETDDQSPTISFYLGSCDGKALPSYYVLELNAPDGKDGLDLICTLCAGDSGSTEARFILMNTESGETALPFDSLFRFTPDAGNPALYKVEGMANIDDEDLQATLQLYRNVSALSGETVTRGLDIQSYLSVSSPKEDTEEKTELYAETQAYDTVDGGENLWTAGSLSDSVHEEITSQDTWSANLAFTPSQEHGTDGTFSLNLTLPQEGIAEFQLNGTLQPVLPDTEGIAALTPVSYESMTDGEREGLLTAVQQNVQQLYWNVLRSIPQDVMDAAKRLTAPADAE